jgi:Ca2+/Na+ antiporter
MATEFKEIGEDLMNLTMGKVLNILVYFLALSLLFFLFVIHDLNISFILSLICLIAYYLTRKEVLHDRAKPTSK